MIVLCLWMLVHKCDPGHGRTPGVMVGVGEVLLGLPSELAVCIEQILLGFWLGATVGPDGVGRSVGNCLDQDCHKLDPSKALLGDRLCLGVPWRRCTAARVPAVIYGGAHNEAS